MPQGGIGKRIFPVSKLFPTFFPTHYGKPDFADEKMADAGKNNSICLFTSRNDCFYEGCKF